MRDPSEVLKYEQLWNQFQQWSKRIAQCVSFNQKVWLMDRKLADIKRSRECCLFDVLWFLGKGEYFVIACYSMISAWVGGILNEKWKARELGWGLTLPYSSWHVHHNGRLQTYAESIRSGWFNLWFTYHFERLNNWVFMCVPKICNRPDASDRYKV